jgi:hypothetical protein
MLLLLPHHIHILADGKEEWYNLKLANFTVRVMVRRTQPHGHTLLQTKVHGSSVQGKGGCGEPTVTAVVFS